MNHKKTKKVELMYRSSKMNEEKVNVMRANVPLPDINDVEGKDSIIRYLPPINNLNTVIKYNFKLNLFQIQIYFQ